MFCHYRIRRGDIDAAFAQADVIIESEYRTPAQEHAFLQPEAGIAYIDEQGRVTVQVAGQWTHEDQEQIAHSLGLPLDQVRVIYPAIGGAFGGREDMSVQIILALAAWRLHQTGIHRPVKIVWSREEFDHRSSQTAPVYNPHPLGSHPPGQGDSSRCRADRRRWSLCLYIHKGDGECHINVHWPL